MRAEAEAEAEAEANAPAIVASFTSGRTTVCSGHKKLT
jgi:hypothetical protein